MLFDYARRAFGTADVAVAAVAEDGRGRASQRPDRIVGTVIMISLTHNSRHLGMIEALRGAMGLKGSATV